MRSVMKQSICIIISILLIIGEISFSPIKNVNASGIEDYGVTDNSVTGSYKLVSTPGGNYFEYDITVTNNSGSIVKDWIAVVNTKGTVDTLINLESWNQLEYFKNDSILYVYPKDSYAINPGNNLTRSKLCYTGSEVADIKVYYSTTENAFDEFKNGGSSGGGEIVDGITDYGVDVELNYAKLLQESLYFFDANMCGSDVSGNSAFSWRGDCHTDDAKFTYNGKTIDLSGGYHDAGDHVKFGLPQAYAATMLGLAYYEYEEDFKELGQSEHALFHLKRFADYFKKCTVMNGNNVEAFCYQVGNGDIDHSYWGKPENQGSRGQAYFTSSQYPCVDIVAETAAALAIYSLIDSSDSSYLTYAKALFNYAEAGGDSSSGQAPGTNPFYIGNTYKDDLALASYWIYQATNDSSYKTKFDNYMNSASDGWGQCWNEVWASAFVSSNNNRITSLLSNMSAKKASSGFVIVDTESAWGTARYNAALQFMALTYDKNNNTDNYKNWAKGQMKYILGNNPAKKCYVVGYNDMTVLHPHHEAASGYQWSSTHPYDAMEHTLIGALVGGPAADDSYDDNAEKYQYTEVALDYQVGLVGAAVGLYHAFKNDDTVDKTLATKSELEALEITKYYGVGGDDPVHEHDLTHVPAKTASCTVDGNIEYWYCSGCKKYFSDEAAENEITLGDTIIQKKAHTPVKAEYSWSEDNSKVTASIKCKNCGEIIEKETVNSTFAEIKATCTENGSIVYSASFESDDFADQTKTVILYAEGHDLKHYPAVVSSCEMEGNIEYWKCSVCNKYFSDEKGITEIAQADTKLALGDHEWGEWVVTKEPTEIEYGEEMRTCIINSDHYEIRAIPPLGHIHIYNKASAIEPTCDVGGNIEYYFCEGCSQLFIKQGDDYKECNYEDVFISALGHDFGPAKYEWNDDFTECTASLKCGRENCGQVISDKGTINKETIVPASCDGDGEDRITAKFTNDRFVEQTKIIVTKKTGHNPVKVEKKEASCITDGNIEYYCCSVCKKNFRDFECTEVLSDEDIIIPLDENAHDFGDVSYVWADDYSTVTASRKCKNDSTHVESETVKTTYAVVKEATDIADGLGVYVSDTFENKAFSVQRKEITIPSKGGAPKPEAPDQKAEDGTDVGPGASEAVADRAIKSSDSDEGPAGSAFGLLQARMKKVTKNSITIGWKKVNGAKYVIYGNQCGKTRKFEKITTVNTNKFSQKKLKKGTYYKYIIVAVKDGKVVSTSKTLHIATKGGKLTNHSKVKVKKTSIKLKNNKTYKIKTKLVKQSKKPKVQNHRKVKYESSNISVATVDNKGKIKAVGKGTAFVYAYAQDGICAKIKVTVK